MKNYCFFACLGVCFYLCLNCGSASAQQIHQDQYSPCNLEKTLSFTNGVSDTVTVNVKYTGITGKLTAADSITLQSIRNIYGHNTNRFQHAIGFAIDNCPQQYYAPLNDRSQITNIVNIANNGYIKLKLVVYRMFFLDGGIYNFFYIDKVSPGIDLSLAAK